ncbi:MAG: 1-acyl-sn-glycerol-3-phosphate acyltransferase [Rhodobacteraceae bacterium]|nr:1-acyl-sn-glycerol-3-phosphate acyltransferase [Paracoccaceae bacterium]
MTSTVELPLWLFVLILLFAAVTFASHFLFPSVRWFVRRRLERAVDRLNRRLERPIQPFKLARRHDMIQRLVYNPAVSQAIVDHASAEGIPENVAFEQAKRYAREIVPSFSTLAYYGFAIRIARFLGNSLYRVRLGNLDEDGIKSIDPHATVVFVMNHRSNMDYVLVTYLAAQRAALSYAVGEWAQVWPLSRLIRAMGAYFIRRKSRNELYRRVLACYIRLATGAGVTQAIFPEGGLSLSGELMPPRMGLLKYLTDAADPAERDIVFVPVALNYDRVLEDSILIAADQGRERRFNARIGLVGRRILHQFWLRITGRFHRFGYAAVSFGHPVSLRAFRARRSGDITTPLAGFLMQRIGEIVPVLPVPLVSWLLLNHGAMTRAEIVEGMDRAALSVPHAHVHVPRHDRDYAAEVGLRNLAERGMIEQVGDRFAPCESGMALLRFYANSIRHLMPPAALAGSAGAKGVSAPAGS